jgi:hypothetical protein
MGATAPGERTMWKLFAATVLAFAVLTTTMPAQQGAAPESDRRTNSELQAQTYGERDRACMAWTDWCRSCRRDGDGASSCDTGSFACMPAEVECVMRYAEHEAVQRWLSGTLSTGP